MGIPGCSGAHPGQKRFKFTDAIRTNRVTQVNVNVVAIWLTGVGLLVEDATPPVVLRTGYTFRLDFMSLPTLPMLIRLSFL